MLAISSPGQPVFPLKPQTDLSCMAAVPLPHLYSQPAQGQAYKVSPVTSLLILRGLQFASPGPGRMPAFGA